jgi:hypothetical protein
MTGRVVPEVEAILARFPSYRLRTTALPSSGTRVTPSSQAELTKTSCFLGPAGTALYLLWLGAVRETKYRAFSTYLNLKVWLIAKFPTIPCYSLIQSLGNLRRLVQIHPSAQRLAQWQESAKKPRTR